MSKPTPQKQDNPQSLPESLRAMRAALRGQKPAAAAKNEKAPATADPTGPTFPLAAQIKEKQAKEAEARKNEKIGTNFPGQGVFVGTWSPKDRNGKSLNQTFNLYAAPKDLGSLVTFNLATVFVAGLKDRHGHDGFDHNIAGKKPDEALYDALRQGRYKGEWFIPPLDVLWNNLYKNKDRFDPAHKFITKSTGLNRASLYWSSTESSKNATNAIRLSFFGGTSGNAHKNKSNRLLSVRLVRAEPVDKTPPFPNTAKNISQPLP